MYDEETPVLGESTVSFGRRRGECHPFGNELARCYTPELSTVVGLMKRRETVAR
jgi:hypothetical protein